MASYHVAIDLGASGGRVALAVFEGGRLEVEILHRFPNGPVELPTPKGLGLYWNVLGLWREILHGLALASERAKGKIASIGVDSWAVDYALLDEFGSLLDGVRCYRDPRTEGVMEEVWRRFPREALFEQTGLQFLPFNTLYQWLASERDTPGRLEAARTFLMLPDLFHYWLTGRAVCERTNASTTQFYDPRGGDWARALLEVLALPSHLLPSIVDPGANLGRLRPELRARLNLEETVVIAVGSHDTASAVAAVPAGGGNWAYLSSGTWSLVGVEKERPVITQAALEANLTNEVGVGSTVRLLKNVMGLWILQECRRAWGDPDWGELYSEAAAVSPARPLGLIFDPDHPSLLPPGSDMPERVRTLCRAGSKGVPRSRAEITRCVLESLALKYRYVLEQLENVTRRRIETLHVVGGGSQIELLNRLTAVVTGRGIVAGPTEATLLGNLLVQAEGLGMLSALERRAVVERSTELSRYRPDDPVPWEPIYDGFKQQLESTTA